MANTPHAPLGRGEIVWLGVNLQRGTFSTPRDQITIEDDGIEGDMYRGMWRAVSGHDGAYVATDGVAKGDRVLNMRQITIIEAAEMARSREAAAVDIENGMLRENIVVRYAAGSGPAFSHLPPLSRMVINHGTPQAKVLLLTEENTPCATVCNPMAAHFGGGPELAARLKQSLGGHRGQMAMVRSARPAQVRLGDPFTIFPPMR